MFLQDSLTGNLREADQSQVTPARQLHKLLDDSLEQGPAFIKLSLSFLVPLSVECSVGNITGEKTDLTLIFQSQYFHPTAGRFSLLSGPISDNSRK